MKSLVLVLLAAVLALLISNNQVESQDWDRSARHSSWPPYHPQHPPWYPGHGHWRRCICVWDRCRYSHRPWCRSCPWGYRQVRRRCPWRQQVRCCPRRRW